METSFKAPTLMANQMDTVLTNGKMELPILENLKMVSRMAEVNGEKTIIQIVITTLELLKVI